MSRPVNTKQETLKSVADAVVWAFKTYGVPSGGTGTRPVNSKLENIKSVSDAVVWAWTT